MRCFAYAALLAATAAPFAAPAFAQDAAPFTGPRIEGIVGWDRSQAGDKDDGVVYGIGAGYDMQMGGAVVGIDAELSDATTRDCIGSRTAADPRLCAAAGRDLYAGGRVGAVVGGSTLLYAKAGYTNGRYKLTSNDGTGTNVVAGRNLDGIRVGAGAEYAVGPNSFVKAEYRYSNYEQGIDRHQVLGGFGFRF